MSIQPPGSFPANSELPVPGEIVISPGGAEWTRVIDVDLLQASASAYSIADSAINMAGTRTRVLYSNDTPSGNGQSIGDTWRQRAEGTGEIVGEWEWTGTEWAQRPISSEAISNLDVGKLTVGTAHIDELVAREIAAETGRFIDIDVSNLVASEAQIDEAVINQLWAEVVHSGFLTADEAIIGGAVIKDDAITAEKITASEELWAKVIGTHKITAAEIDAGSIAAEIVQGNYFEGEVFSGVNFYGSTFESSQPGTGVRIVNSTDSVLRSRGLIQFNAPSLNSGAQIYLSTSSSDPVSGGVIGSFTLQSPYNSAPSESARIELNSRTSGGSIFLRGEDTIAVFAGDYFSVNADIVNIMPDRNANIWAGQNIVLEAGRASSSTIYNRIDFDATEVRLVRTNSTLSIGNGILHGNRGGTSRDFEINVVGSAAFTVLASAGVRHPDHRTHANPANMYIATTTGEIRRSTSVRAAKVNIQDVEETLPERLLSVVPKTFYDRGDAEDYAEYMHRMEQGRSTEEIRVEDIETLHPIGGLIAEEVEEAGLGTYVSRDEEGNPTGIAYDRLWTLLIPLVREQRNKIAELEQKMEELSS